MYFSEIWWENYYKSSFEIYFKEIFVWYDCFTAYKGVFLQKATQSLIPYKNNYNTYK